MGCSSFGAGRRFLSVSFSRIQLHCLVLPKENGMLIFYSGQEWNIPIPVPPIPRLFQRQKTTPQESLRCPAGPLSRSHSPGAEGRAFPLPDPVLISSPAKQNSPCVLPGGISNIPWNRIADSYPCCIRIQSRHNTFPLDSFVPRLQSNCV